MCSWNGCDAAIPIDRHGLSRCVRSTRAGRLSDSQFGRRHRGTGNMAEMIADTFHVWTKKCGLDGDLPPLNADDFRPPRISSGQLRLF